MNPFERIRVENLRRFSTFVILLKESTGGFDRRRVKQSLHVQA